jgi:hypothetical protein
LLRSRGRDVWLWNSTLSTIVHPVSTLLYSLYPDRTIFWVIVSVRDSNLDRAVFAHSVVERGAIWHADLQHARFEPAEFDVRASLPLAVRVQYWRARGFICPSKFHAEPVLGEQSGVR